MLHHKIMHAMAARDAVHQLGGNMQMDDAYRGGERAGGKLGRGSENKVPIVAAASLNAEGHPRYLKLSRIVDFTNDVGKQCAKTDSDPVAASPATVWRPLRRWWMTAMSQR
jgi:hypothetical protein